MPASDRYGWPQFEFGEGIGPDERYVIVRKLGLGMTSSTWLARNLRQVLFASSLIESSIHFVSRENKFVAIKGLTGYATGLVHRGRIWELEALKLVSASSNTPHCLNLLSSNWEGQFWRTHA